MDAKIGGGGMSDARDAFRDYLARLNAAAGLIDLDAVAILGRAIQTAWREGRQVFLFGNGGSAGNALHIANDLFYGIAKKGGAGVRVHALPANVSVLTCLANDEGYSEIYALQLANLARSGDVAIALSGSGNSPNILRGLETARKLGLKTFAILGFTGGAARTLADHPIHVPVNDMQISEDLQVMIGHMLMQWLAEAGPAEAVGQ